MKKEQKSIELINKINENCISGSELFNNRDWYKLNRLMVYNLSDESSVMFSFLCDVENRWKSRMYEFYNKLDGHFMLKVKYVNDFLNKDSKQQRRALNNLKKVGLIDIKHWAGNVRTIKINWDNFSKLYVQWIKEYNKLEKENSGDPIEEMFEDFQTRNLMGTFRKAQK